MNVTIAKQATDNHHSSRVSGIEKEKQLWETLLFNCLLPFTSKTADTPLPFVQKAFAGQA